MPSTRRPNAFRNSRPGRAPAQDQGFLGNLGRSLFGGGQPAPRPGYDSSAYQRSAAQPPAAAPAYAPPPPAGPWSAPSAAPRGGGFLSGALTAATGVAGGLLAANAIESLLGGGRGGLFGGFGGAGFGGAGFGGGETVVNNFYDAPNRADGGVGAALPDAGGDPGGFQDAADYSDSGDDNGGGFDDGGSGGGFDV